MEQIPTPPPIPPPVHASSTFAEPPVPVQEPSRLDYLVPLRVDGVALLAGYLGLVSVLLVFAPLALISGLVGLRRIKEHPGRTGKGRALFGVVMGGLGTLGLIWAIVSFT